MTGIAESARKSTLLKDSGLDGTGSIVPGGYSGNFFSVGAFGSSRVIQNGKLLPGRDGKKTPALAILAVSVGTSRRLLRVQSKHVIALYRFPPSRRDRIPRRSVSIRCRFLWPQDKFDSRSGKRAHCFPIRRDGGCSESNETALAARTDCLFRAGSFSRNRCVCERSRLCEAAFCGLWQSRETGTAY